MTFWLHQLEYYDSIHITCSHKNSDKYLNNNIATVWKLVT